MENKTVIVEKDDPPAFLHISRSGVSNKNVTKIVTAKNNANDKNVRQNSLNKFTRMRDIPLISSKIGSNKSSHSKIGRKPDNKLLNSTIALPDVVSKNVATKAKPIRVPLKQEQKSVVAGQRNKTSAKKAPVQSKKGVERVAGGVYDKVGSYHPVLKNEVITELGRIIFFGDDNIYNVNSNRVSLLGY